MPGMVFACCSSVHMSCCDCDWYSCARPTGSKGTSNLYCHGPASVYGASHAYSSNGSTNCPVDVLVRKKPVMGSKMMGYLAARARRVAASEVWPNAAAAPAMA